jgi:TIR domain-containing protein
MTAPRTFCIHSSLDNEDFAKPLATRLRANGVDVWLSDWELLGGDSLVARIHGGALKDAEIMMAVLSVNTVDSKWVRDELDAATVRRIQEECRLIPVVVGDCPIPPAVAHLFQIRVQREDVDRAADEVLRAIFNISTAPPLGQAPKYATKPASPGIRPTDAVVLRLICEATLRDPYQHVDLEELVDIAAREGLSEDALTESLEVLVEQGYLDAPRANAVRFNGIIAALATSEGLLAYAEWAMPDFEKVLRSVATEVREGTTDSGVAVVVGQPIRFVEAVLDRFALLGWISLTKFAGGPGHVYVDRVSPQLRRALQ